MSVDGHLGRSGAKGKGRARILTNARGPVLSGEMSVAERLAKEAIEAAVGGEVFGVELPGGVKGRRVRGSYWDVPSVAGYDPVLAWHCRLVGEAEEGEKR